VLKEDGIEMKFSSSLVGDEKSDKTSWNIMDRWILSATQSLIVWFKKEMAAYRLYTVVPVLVKFIDQLTNWYVRLNRRRLKGETGAEDCHRALEVFFLVLFTVTRLMAPFTPFITEHIYQNLKRVIKKTQTGEDESIHYLMLPDVQEWLIDQEVENGVEGMQKVIELGRVARDRRALPIKFPLPEVVLVHSDEQFLQGVKGLENYVLEELNVKKLTLSSNKAAYNVHLKAQPNHQKLGLKYKAEFKNMANTIKSFTDAEVEKCVEMKGIDVCGKWVELDELFITYDVGGGGGHLEAACDGPVLVILNTSADENMQNEGISREIINRIQKLRKKAHLVPTDKVTVYLKYDQSLSHVVDQYSESIQNAIKATVLPYPSGSCDLGFLIQEDFMIKESKLHVAIVKEGAGATADSKNDTTTASVGNPSCKFVNVVVAENLRCSSRKMGWTGTILLENPFGKSALSLDQLHSAVEDLFFLHSRPFNMFDTKGQKVKDVSKLTGTTVYLTKEDKPWKDNQSHNKPAVPFLNVSGKGGEVTVLLENPVGTKLFQSHEEAKKFGETLL